MNVMQFQQAIEIALKVALETHAIPGAGQDDASEQAKCFVIGLVYGLRYCDPVLARKLEALCNPHAFLPIESGQ